eukprot:511240_1
MYNNISNHQNVNILYNSSFVILVTVQNELCSSMLKSNTVTVCIFSIPHHCLFKRLWYIDYIMMALMRIKIMNCWNCSQIQPHISVNSIIIKRFSEPNNKFKSHFVPFLPVNCFECV